MTGLDAAALAAAPIEIAVYQRRGGPTARTTDTVERIAGRPARSLQAFFGDHADELRRPSE